MNITQMQSILAPVLAPVAPAVLFGNNLYAGMLADNIDPTFALVAASGGTLGVEVSGALACSMAVLAYHKRDYKVMIVSIIASLVYAVFVYRGIMTAQNSSAFAGSVIISLIAYLMLGVYQSYANKLQTEQAQTDLKIKAMEAERKLVNAQTRQAKAGRSQPENYTKVSETFGGHTDWRNVGPDDRAKIAAMTTREIQLVYQVSERTAQNWKQYAQESHE